MRIYESGLLLFKTYIVNLIFYQRFE